jgi:hypothetical protein
VSPVAAWAYAVVQGLVLHGLLGRQAPAAAVGAAQPRAGARELVVDVVVLKQALEDRGGLGAGHGSRSASFGALLGFRAFLAGPAAAQRGESASGVLVDGAAHEAEQRAFDQQGERQPAQFDLAVLGPRRLLILDLAPDDVEELFGELSGSSEVTMPMGRSTSFPIAPVRGRR